METPNHLSILGIIHTAISIIALLAAFYSLYRSGRIDPATGPGRLYIWLTIFTCLTAFPIMKTGHFTPGHYVAIVILVLLPPQVFTRGRCGYLVNWQIMYRYSACRPRYFYH